MLLVALATHSFQDRVQASWLSPLGPVMAFFIASTLPSCLSVLVFHIPSTQPVISITTFLKHLGLAYLTILVLQSTQTVLQKPTSKSALLKSTPSLKFNLEIIVRCAIGASRFFLSITIMADRIFLPLTGLVITKEKAIHIESICIFHIITLSKVKVISVWFWLVNDWEWLQKQTVNDFWFWDATKEFSYV